MESEEGATVCADAHQEAAAALKEAAGGGGKRRRKQQRKGGDGGGRKKYALVSYHELPEYMKENEFILNYYRLNELVEVVTVGEQEYEEIIEEYEEFLEPPLTDFVDTAPDQGAA